MCRIFENWPVALPPWIQVALVSAILLVSFVGARAAWRANKFTKKTMAGTLRPWISLTPSVAIEFSHGVGDDDGQYVKVPFTLRNHGQSPALSVKVLGRIYLIRPDEPLEDEYKKFVNETSDSLQVRTRDDIYPNQEDYETINLCVGWSDLDSARKAWAKYFDKDGDDSFSFPKKWRVFLMVQYRSPHDSERHKTSAAFHIGYPSGPTDDEEPEEIFFGDNYDPDGVEIIRYHGAPHSQPD